MNPVRISRVLIVFWGALLFLCTVPDPVRSQTVLTKGKIQEIIDLMDSAIGEKKADEVVRFMSPDISIEVFLIQADQSRRIQMGREGYRQHLNKAFQSIDEYVFTRSTMEIDIAPDGKSASAETHLVEKMTVGDRVLRAVTREVSEFKVLRGEIFITSIRSIANVEEGGGTRYTGRTAK